MEFLKQSVLGSTKNVVELYREKHLAWAKERFEWEKGKIEAAKRAAAAYPPESGSDYIGKQKQYINDWNQENYYTFKASVQAAWMDWMINGEKYNLDCNFGMIDIDSITGRIESSKESLRNSTIPDETGSSEGYGVSLTLNQWATYCKRKAEAWYERNGQYTLAQLDSKIARLESLLSSYKSADALLKPDKDSNAQYPVEGAVAPTSDLTKTKQAVTDAMTAL